MPDNSQYVADILKQNQNGIPSNDAPTDITPEPSRSDVIKQLMTPGGTSHPYLDALGRFASGGIHGLFKGTPYEWKDPIANVLTSPAVNDALSFGMPQLGITKLWGSARIAELQKHLNMRKSYQEIADAMGGGLTKDAVASQAQRMGWSQPAEDTRARLAISAVKGSAAKTANSFWRNNQRKLKELSGFVGSGVSDADIAAKLNAPEEFIQHGMKLLTKFPAPP